MRWGLLLAALLLPLPALPALARPVVVVELFTSEACSDCPPAEQFLRQLQASDPAVLPLSFHVTYWDGPTWTDRYSLQASTDRQDWYAGLQNSEMFTPETVVNGTKALVGSDRAGITAAIAAAGGAASVPVAVAVRDGARVAVAVGAGAGLATVWLIGYDPLHITAIGGGENGGATVAEANVVRSISRLGTWHSAAATFGAARPAGAKLAVLVQRDDGGIEGAASN